MSRDSTLTYGSAEEFTRMGESAFGRGWQVRFSEWVRYDRVTISEFARGVRPIPPHIMICMLSAVTSLARGEPVRMVEPVGRILSDGRFVAIAAKAS